MTTLNTALEEVDRSNALKITSCIIFGITFVFVVARQAMKAVVFHRAGLDDLFILLASAFAVALSIITFVLASEGLGNSGSLRKEQNDALMKGNYASEFLYISALCFSKLSVLVLFHSIVVVQRTYRRLMTCLGVSILAWTVASLAAIAFRCILPRPWETSPLWCFDIPAFWIAYCIIDIATEAALIMLSVTLVIYLQLRLSRKVAFVACFAPRILVLSVALVRLVGLYPLKPHDIPQYRLWIPAITTQVQVCLSICTACIPYMVPFFKSLYGNLVASKGTRSRNQNIDEESGCSSSPWFRRRRQVISLDPRDQREFKSIPYEHVAQASPYIPTSKPLSPLTPPRPKTPSTRQTSVRGLNIYIPCRDPQKQPSLELMGPLTASSCALSPTCASPQPLLAKSYIPSRKAPTPPPKIYSPLPPTAPSRIPTPPHAQRFTLFPAQPSPSRSAQPKQAGSVKSSVPPTGALTQNTLSSLLPHPEILSSPFHATNPVRADSRAQPPKFSTTRYLQTPPLVTIHTRPIARPGSIQDLTSPMGAAINSYFSSADVPLSLAPEGLSAVSATPTSPYENLAHSPNDRDYIQDELFMSRDSILMTQRSRAHTMPVVRDVRNSPYVVLRSPA